MSKIKRAMLVYQCGIARLIQADFRTCEAFARGLSVAGVTVRNAACNMAGDIASLTWSDNLEEQPFSEKFSPVGGRKANGLECR